jgi:hypothetical protein
MKVHRKSILLIIILIVTLFSCNDKQGQVSDSNTKYIDMDIGGVGHLATALPGLQSNCRTRWSRMYPIRKDYIDDQISWYPMSTISHIAMENCSE